MKGIKLPCAADHLLQHEIPRYDAHKLLRLELPKPKRSKRFHLDMTTLQ